LVHGRKSPTLETAGRLLKEAGFELDIRPLVTFTEQLTPRGRTVTVPNMLPRLTVQQALATVVLPLHLNWSDPGRRFDLADRLQRARMYEIVLREGGPEDILAYVDGALLVDLWDELVLPSGLPSSRPRQRRHSVRPPPRTTRATPFQVRLARLFFSLPDSAGFLLAGGAALAAQFLTTRPTQDLDFFTGPDLGNIPKASAAFETAVRANGWSIRRVRDSPTFHRMVISGPQDVLVDLALDAPPAHAAVPSVAGPTFALEELAGRKVVALFDPNGSPTPA
jgi:hypothetical protein